MCVSTYDVFIKNYWGASSLKVTFRNYKKILYARSDMICFDDIVNQIEPSISNNIVKIFFTLLLH